jgi:hypothetical protein
MAGATSLPAGTRLPLGDPVILRLDQPFLLTAGWPVSTWCAAGRLLHRRPGRGRLPRVEIEVSEWSARAGELRLSAVGPSIRMMGKRQQRRYFAAAHVAADQLARLLAETTQAAASERSLPRGQQTNQRSGHRTNHKEGFTNGFDHQGDPHRRTA